RWITPLLRELLDRPIEPGLFYNVNLPLLPAGAPDPEVIWCPLDPKPLPLNYRHEEETGLYFAGDYNLRGRRPRPIVNFALKGTMAFQQVKWFREEAISSGGKPRRGAPVCSCDAS